jgi:hypothetical protein
MDASIKAAFDKFNAAFEEFRTAVTAEETAETTPEKEPGEMTDEELNQAIPAKPKP